jgi:tRNA(Ile)-lysidine synthase TilS/MesJ
MNPIKKVLGCFRKADNDYHMIEDGDRIAVGVSGGKDSSCLIHCLHLYKMFSKKNFDVIGIYVDLGFGQQHMDEVIEYFRPYDIPIYVVETQIYDILKLHLDKEDRIECSLCAKLRKGALVNAAKAHGCNKIALGHHSDDAVETLFMNMINGGRLATFKPKMLLERSGVTMIRPLVYAYEHDISRMADKLEMPVSKNACPNSGHTERQAMKDMLNSLYKDYPSSKNNFQLMLRNNEQVDIFKPENDDEEDIQERIMP